MIEGAVEEKASSLIPKITYRRGGEDDILGMQHLDQICFPAGMAFSAQEFAFRLRQRGSVAILAEQGSKLVGLILTSVQRGGVGYIVSLDVHPDVRRRGIGRALLRMGEDGLVQRGLREILLQVGVDNEAALQLYRAEGYTVRSKLSGYYGWGKDAFLMGKIVAGSTRAEG